MSLHIAMVVPPLSDLNTPYAAAPRLAGWLRKLGHRVDLLDLNLDLFLRIFSRRGLERLFGVIEPASVHLDLEDVYQNRDRYIRIIDSVVAFAQGRDLTPAHRIARGDLLPEGPRFRHGDPELRDALFGEFGTLDRARHLVSFCFGDLADLFARTISPHLAVTSYGEKLAESRASFDMYERELEREPNEIERMICEMAAERIPESTDLVCFTVPFPGMLFSALIMGKYLAQHRPHTARALGGGYPSTELRRISDPRFFKYVDYLVLDDGEVPLQQICARREGQPNAPLVRTFTCEGGTVAFHDAACDAPRFRELPPPDYSGTEWDRYIHVIYRLNHISRLLSEGSWLKLTAAHGCYWKKCTFCDIHLSYIGDFDPMSASALADQMDAMHAQTGRSGFHFTDEAVPPSLLVKLALELLRRGRSYQFWGNIRYDTNFTPDRCRVLAAAGMIAVTGGIEIASDELLPKISKGITVNQVIKVLQAFSSAGIRTHAYLIYGFPGETRQDTVNSLEILRQLSKAKILHSGFYHQFSATTHSPVGRTPELFGIRLTGPTFGGFADYVHSYEPTTTERPSETTFRGLNHAMEAFARGEHLDSDVMRWIRDNECPRPTIAPSFVADVMATNTPAKAAPHVCWLGGEPHWEKGLLSVSCFNGEIFTTPTPKWVAENLWRAHPAGWTQPSPPSPSQFERQDWFAPFRERGLVLI